MGVGTCRVPRAGGRLPAWLAVYFMASRHKLSRRHALERSAVNLTRGELWDIPLQQQHQQQQRSYSGRPLKRGNWCTPISRSTTATKLSNMVTAAYTHVQAHHQQRCETPDAGGIANTRQDARLRD